MAETKKISELKVSTELVEDNIHFLVVDKSITSGDDASITGRTSKVTLAQIRNAVDATGPTFETFEVQSTNQHVAGTITGDLVFKFNEPVQFNDGTTARDLQTSDFVLMTGSGAAITNGKLLTATTDYVLANNVGDKTFVLRYTSAGTTKMGTDPAEDGADIRISGGMGSSNIKDLLGNAIDNVETGIHGPVDSIQYDGA